MNGPPSSRKMILAGILLTVAGIALAFLFAPSGPQETSRLADGLALLFLALGSLLALIGGLTWARHTTTLRLGEMGIMILILGAIAVRLVPIRLHDWTVSVGFPLATTGLLGALFVVFAVIRWVLVHVVKR
jgi:hypothetical protein